MKKKICEYVMGMMGVTRREIDGGGSTFYLIVVEIVDTHGRTELEIGWVGTAKWCARGLLGESSVPRVSLYPLPQTLCCRFATVIMIEVQGNGEIE